VRTAEEVFQSLAHKLDRVASHQRRREVQRATALLEMGNIP
jgi:hypothetical protein